MGQQLATTDQEIGLAHASAFLRCAAFRTADVSLVYFRIVSRLTPVMSETVCWDRRVCLASITARSMRPCLSSANARAFMKSSTRSASVVVPSATARRKRCTSRSMSLNEWPANANTRMSIQRAKRA
ncbi:hypothetical protein G6F59_016514 [Rhizopus arrhizus]|nr:hypothetical protein G6F59_016514 [Rhizopus arrhizus]